MFRSRLLICQRNAVEENMFNEVEGVRELSPLGDKIRRVEDIKLL